MHKFTRILFLAAALLFVDKSVAQSTAPGEISTDRLKKDISYLASDKLKGRGTGSKGETKAAKYIAGEFKKAGLAPKGSNGFFYPFTFKKATDPKDTSTTNLKTRKGTDVIAYLDNGAAMTVVIGAHYDHLGLGYDHNSLDPNPEGKIHNGADDNASGTAGVLELARYYAGNQIKENVNFLFICFSGEELGLIGSKKFCEHPTIDLKTVDFMINMDMIGRLNDSSKTLIIYGVGTAADWVPMIDQMRTSFHIKKDSAGIGPSDQTSFYLKEIPVLHFFTGQHPDYHKPSDDVTKINFEGEKTVLEYITIIIEKAAAKPKLVYLQTKNGSEGGRHSYKVTLGVMPDYAYEGKGMRIDGVTNGKPAFKAGIKAGDVVTEMGGIPVNNMMDYMKALGTFKAGDTTTVKIKRGEEELHLEVTF